MDEADEASFRIERDEKLANEAARKYTGPTATGHCLAPHCGITLVHGQRWCNVECRDEYEKSRRIYGGK